MSAAKVGGDERRAQLRGRDEHAADMLFTGVNAALSGTDVTTRPLERAREGRTGNQLNVCLYRTSINSDLRSMTPQGLQPREEGFPSLPLSLF